MWLFKSSVGRKVIMSVTGLALVLFLTFHMSMNCVAIISPESYNMICATLGANWYAVVASIALAGLMIIHIIYALLLTLQNRRARGANRYVVNYRPKGVEWSSKNMLVLGVVVLLGLALHLLNFWYRMQFAELVGNHEIATSIAGVESPSDGVGLIRYTFSKWYYVLFYIVWLVALWMHLNHGFWSALHTLGASNNKWLCRIRVISTVVTTIIIVGFALVVFFYFANHLLIA